MFFFNGNTRSVRAETSQNSCEYRDQTELCGLPTTFFFCCCTFLRTRATAVQLAETYKWNGNRYPDLREGINVITPYRAAQNGFCFSYTLSSQIVTTVKPTETKVGRYTYLSRADSERKEDCRDNRPPSRYHRPFLGILYLISAGNIRVRPVMK